MANIQTRFPVASPQTGKLSTCCGLATGEADVMDFGLDGTKQLGALWPCATVVVL